MANPIVYYPGDYITCYPGSNQTDDGKLNLEFNMARIVTRITSKNFCIVEPSFTLTLVTNSTTGAQSIQVGTGECSINGMDLIMTTTLSIDPPEEAGHWYLAFHLARDGSENVLSDLVVGVNRTFQGVYLTYFSEKPDPQTNMDILYLGSFDYDGVYITNLEEDEDKYCSIWADEVLAKIEDPKHPDITRLTVQELIYLLPDWYMSKEGDTMYGQLIIVDSETNNREGILINVDENGSHITIKDPELENDKLIFYGDINQDGVIDQTDADLIQQYIDGEITFTDLQRNIGDVNHDGLIDEKDLEYIMNFINGEGNAGDVGNTYYIQVIETGISIDVEDGISSIRIAKAKIYEDESTDELHIHNEGDICIDAEGELNVEADGQITISTEETESPNLILTDDIVQITKASSDLVFSVSYPTNNTIQQVLGKAIWQYDNTSRNVTLLQDNVNYLDIVPNGIFEQNLTVQDTLYLGPLGEEYTYLRQDRWQISDNANKQIRITASSIVSTNSSLSATDNSYILLSNSADSIHTRIYDDAKIELLNPSRAATILWKDGTAAYDVTLEKVIGEQKLNLQGSFNVTNNIVAEGSVTGNGLVTTSGTITFERGTNNATITKDNNSTTLRTNGNLYVGTSGSSNLYAGNTVINGTFAVGGSTYDGAEFQVDASGNLTTSGTITGAKVYNAVYNDGVEFMKKSNKEEVINAGDIVFFDNNGNVTKWNATIDIKCLAGVVSSEETYGYALGGEGLKDNEKVPVALFGRVYINTDLKDLTIGDIISVNNEGKLYVSNEYSRYSLGVVCCLQNNKVMIKIK